MEDEIARHVRHRADDFVAALNNLQVRWCVYGCAGLECVSGIGKPPAVDLNIDCNVAVVGSVVLRGQVLEKNVGNACATISSVQTALARVKQHGAVDALKRLVLQRRRVRLLQVRAKV